MNSRLKTLGVSVLLAGCGGGGSSDSSNSAQSTPLPANLAPTIAASAALNVLEGQNLTAQIMASDPNMDTVTLSLELNSGDSNLFNLASTGQVRFKSLPDFEVPVDADRNNVYQLTVIASDGSLSSTQSISVTVKDAFEGRVVDGPLADAFLFVDLNGNEIRDQGEPFGTTDSSGFFFIPQFSIAPGQTARLISQGGTDTATSIELPNHILIAPLDSNTDGFQAVTPLTTLLSAATDGSGRNDILRALGLSSSISDALSLDAWSESQAGSAEAQALQKTNLQIGVLIYSVQTPLSDSATTSAENLSIVQSISAEI